MQRWLNAEVLATDAVDDALWTVAMERAPAPAQRIMLAIRTVERAVGQAREEQRDSWAGPAARYLRSVWVNHTLINELRQNAVSVLNAVQMFGHASELHVRLHPVVFPASSDETSGVPSRAGSRTSRPRSSKRCRADRWSIASPAKPQRSDLSKARVRPPERARDALRPPPGANGASAQRPHAWDRHDQGGGKRR